MEKTVQLGGTGVITSGRDGDERLRFFEFHPDEEGLLDATPCRVAGQLQLMRNHTVNFVASKKRIRNNALLICKAAHGRLSGTRDHAYQLTLKVFATEGIDWQKAFVTEPIEVMTQLMGCERMREILTNMLNRLDSEAYGA